MEKLDISSALFNHLNQEYNKAKNEQLFGYQLHNGFDLLEANIKFIAILVLSILKQEDQEAYKKVFSAFRAKSSLGNYYFILLEALNVECNSSLFKSIKRILSQKVIVELETAATILYGQNQTKKIDSFLNKNNRKPNYKIDSILSYSLDFRNRIKGHSATFRDEEKSYVIRILKNLDRLLITLQKFTNDLLAIESLEFFTVGYLHTNANFKNHHSHNLRKIKAKFDVHEYELSPFISYIECDRYTCSINHRNKIFFINEVENSKSFYLDYLYNHMWKVNTIGNDWKIDCFESDIKKFQKELSNNSNQNTFEHLSRIFVGRVKELEEIEHFLQNNIINNTLTIISGKPGIGKSSFITKLQANILEKHSELLSFIYYSVQGNNGNNESKVFIEKLRKYLYSNDVKLDRYKNNDDISTEFEQLESTFLSLSKQERPFLLIIDGLDEFKSPIDFLQNLPLASIPCNTKLHIIFTTRNYKEITTFLAKKCTNLISFKINNKTEISQNGYSFEMNFLNNYDALDLVKEVLPKDFLQENGSNDIINTIIEKSECLPIYLHYICEKIKNTEIINFETISTIANNLPDKLNEFYLDTFKKVPTLSRKILLTIFFSSNGISFDALNLLLKPEKMDEIEFESNYFELIQIFLKEDEKGNFTFYHLSLKDSIFKFYKDELKEIFIAKTDQCVNNFFQINPDLNDQIIKKKITETYSIFLSNNYIYSGSIYHLIEDIMKNTIKNHQNYQLIDFITDNFFEISYIFHLSKILSFNSENEQILNSIRESLNILNIFIEKLSINQLRHVYNLALFVDDFNFLIKLNEIYNLKISEWLLEIFSDSSKCLNEFKRYQDFWFNELSNDQQQILKTYLTYSRLDKNNLILEYINDLEKEYGQYLLLNDDNFDNDIEYIEQKSLIITEELIEQTPDELYDYPQVIGKKESYIIEYIKNNKIGNEKIQYFEQYIHNESCLIDFYVLTNNNYKLYSLLNTTSYVDTLLHYFQYITDPIEMISLTRKCFQIEQTNHIKQTISDLMCKLSKHTKFSSNIIFQLEKGLQISIILNTLPHIQMEKEKYDLINHYISITENLAWYDASHYLSLIVPLVDDYIERENLINKILVILENEKDIDIRGDFLSFLIEQVALIDIDRAKNLINNSCKIFMHELNSKFFICSFNVGNIDQAKKYFNMIRGNSMREKFRAELHILKHCFVNDNFDILKKFNIEVSDELLSHLFKDLTESLNSDLEIKLFNLFHSDGTKLVHLANMTILSVYSNDFLLSIISKTKFLMKDAITYCLNKKADNILLEYYRIKKEKNLLQEIEIELHKLYQLIKETKKTKNIMLYKQYISQSESIKKNILENRGVYTDFLSKYNIDEFEFETTDILELIQSSRRSNSFV